MLMVSVAWGHKYSPLEHWKVLSLETGLPVWVCNRTGVEQVVDWTKAESMILKNGEILTRYYGEAALLLFDWDMECMTPITNGFRVIPIDSIEGVKNGDRF